MTDIPNDRELKQRPSWKEELGYDGPHVNVWVKCPNGHIGLLDHEIADDGTVTPSVMCMHAGCDFHEMVRLAGWKP